MVLWSIAVLLWLITAGTSLAGTVALVRSLKVSRGVATRGTVVEFETDDDGVVPVCEYVVDGRVFRVSASVVYSKTAFPIGSTMALRYLAGAPNTARIIEGSNLFASTIALYVAAVMFGALAGGLTSAML